MSADTYERIVFFPFRAVLHVLGMVWRVVDVVVLATRPPLLRAYLQVVRAEWRRSPYKWARAYRDVASIKASGQSSAELVYGEVPVFVGVWILWRAGVTAGTRFLDIGAGRGRVLIAARRLGAQTRGIEIVTDHVLQVARPLTLVGAHLEVGDGLEVSLDDVDVVFVNWTGFVEDTRVRLAARLAELPSGKTVVLVTHPIDNDAFELKKQFWAVFTWGVERVHIYTRV